MAKKARSNVLHARSLTARGNSGRYSFYRVYVFSQPNTRLKLGEYPSSIAQFLHKHDMTRDGELRQRCYDFPASAYLELSNILRTEFEWDSLNPTTANALPYAVELCNPLNDCVRRFARNPELRLPQPRPDENRIPKHVHQQMQQSARVARGKLPPMHERTKLIIEIEDRDEIATVAIVRVFTDGEPSSTFIYAMDGRIITLKDLTVTARRDLTEQRREYFGA